MKNLLTIILSFVFFPDNYFCLNSPSTELQGLQANEYGNIHKIQEGINVTNSGYEAQFLIDKIRFTPTTNAPSLEWSLVGADKVQPHVVHGKIIYSRKDYTEEYILSSRTIEQQFVVQNLPGNDGPLVIRGSITSKGEFATEEKRWAWRNEYGAVTLSDVFAYDANHKEVPAHMEVSSTGTKIEIKREDLLQAVFPVTIDPELGSDFRISTFGGNGNLAYLTFNSSITYSVSTNKYLTVWSGRNNNEFEIYGQLMDGTTGSPSGSTITISNMGPLGDVNYAALQPDVASSGSEFLVVWSADDNTSPLVDNEFEIYGQRVNASSGALIGSRVRISDMGPDGDANYDATAPSIVYNETNSEYLVAWQGDDNTGSLVNDEFEIYVQRLSSTGDGTAFVNDFRISDMGLDGNVAFQAFTPDIAWNSTNNQYMVVWRGDDSLSPLVNDEYEIFAQLLTSSATATGSNDLRLSFMGPNGNVLYGADEPSIAYNSIDNNFFVAWTSDNNTGGVIDDELEIYGIPLSNTGTIGTMVRVSDMGPDGITNYAALGPSVQHDSNLNQFLVVWQGDDNVATIDNEYEIFGQLISGAGAEVSSDIRLSSVGGSGNTTYQAQSPSIVYNNTQREFMITWHGDNNIIGGMVDNEFEIWGQRFAEASVEPAAQPTAPVFSPPTSSSFNVSFTAATGSPDGYIVLRKAGSSPTDVPVDQTVYNVNDVIGTSTVVYIGNSLNFSQSGLAANTNYHYDFFTYNGVNSSLNYRTSSPLQGNVNTLFAEPATQGTFSFSSFGTGSIALNLSAGNGSNRLLVVKAGSAVDVFPVDGTSYTPNNNITLAPDLGSSNFVVGSGTGLVTVTGLSLATVYHFRVFEFNGTATLTNYNTSSVANSTGSQSTLSAEPTAQPTAINFTSVTNTSFSVGFTAASGPPTGYIAIRKQGSAPAQPADLPVDGTSYALNDPVGGSTVAYVGSPASFNQSSLSAATEYYYLILSYNGSGANINYRATTPLAGNKFTLANQPSAQPTSIVFSNPTISSINVGFTAASGSPAGYLVLRRPGTAPTDVPTDATAYTAGNTIGTSTVAYVGATTGFNDTGLLTNTVYHYAVFSFNGSATTLNYLTTSPLIGNRTTLQTEPTNQPTTLTFSAVTSSSMNGSFTAAAGSPAGYIVLHKAGSSPTDIPVDGTAYSVGSMIGTSTVVFAGSSTSFSATSLSSGVAHHFDVFSFNGSAGSINYRTSSPLEGNQTTTVVEPTAQPTALSFNSVTPTSMNGSFTTAVGNPVGYLVLRKAGSSPTDVPTDGVSYSVGNMIGSSFIVHVGSATSFSSTGLTAQTLYFYDVFAYNGAGITSNYLLTSPLEGSKTTLATEPTAQPTGLTFTLHSTNTVRLNFTPAVGSPTGYLLIRKEGAASAGIPVDGTTYTIGNSLDGTIVAIGSATQLDDSGLLAGISYHYTIFSYTGSGQATNYLTSPVGVTSSTITLPDAPSGQPATGVGQTTFTANWSAVTGAAIYRLDVSTDNFATFVSGYNSQSVSVLFETLISLTASTPYKYRVRAENAIGLQSANSNVVSATTDAASGGSSLQISQPAVTDQGENKIISVTLTNGSGTPVVKFFSRKIMAETFTETLIPTASSGTTYQTTVTPSMLDELGLEFYFTAEDASVTAPKRSPETKNEYIYTPLAANEKSIPNLSSGGQIQNYRIISMPYALTDNLVQSVFGVMGEYDKEQWRLIQYQPSNNRNVDYPAFNRIEPGKGYWFNSLDAVEIKIGAGTAPKFNQDNAFTLNLAKGWNQIGAPYPFDIDWDDVQAANPGKVVGKLNVFNPNSSTMGESNTLKAWSGGFVFADDAISNFSYPVILKNTAGGRTYSVNEIEDNTIDAAEWFVALSLTHGPAENRVIGIGMHPEALESKDRFDEIAVPRFFNHLEMSTHHQEFFAPNFARDVVPTTNQHTWQFIVSSSFGSGEATVQWDSEKFGSNAAVLILYDEEAQIFVDMRKHNRYTFTMKEDRKLRIIYSHDQAWNPGLTMLGRPYPNPAVGSVTIPVILNEAASVQIEILDMTGRKLKTVNWQNMNAGMHDVIWTGEDESGVRVPGGMYLIQMKTGNSFKQVQKIIVR
jgi:hypothetical protein